LNRLIPVGRLFFAAGLIAIGIEHFIFRDFVTGRAPPWPASLPGQMVWAAVSGLMIIAAGISILTGKRTRVAMVLTALLIFVWALLRHIPVVAADAVLGGSWTRAGKSLVFIGACLVIAATSRPEGGGAGPLSRLAGQTDAFVAVGRICLGVFLLDSGIQHFMFTSFVASLMPAWFPGDPVFWTRFAGVCLISGGVGLLVPRTARLAALLSGGMVFSWVWLVHVPRFPMSVSDKIAVFEALAFSGLSFVIAGLLSHRTENREGPGVSQGLLVETTRRAMGDQ
jgi:uncharacterized membrane protein YphA (DoxX/SURF4 family)